ncbi:MAG: hypothetical protein JWM56_934 [Candidatus Peribacteria bacterium]|nr:hypothetical protein [Candidatus Peribacteria bacterium]
MTQKTNTSPETVAAMQHIYSILMGAIEPDLLPENMDSLEKKFKSETTEQKRERSERYEKAFALFEERFSYLMSAYKDHIGDIKKTLMTEYKIKSTQEDAAALNAVEQSLNQSNA